MGTPADAYATLLADLKEALADSDLRVADEISAAVDARTVVVGPPTFVWEGMCAPDDEPTSIRYDVYLIERVDDRALERLLGHLPALLSAVASLGTETQLTGDVAPAAFPSGDTDLPAYQFSAETTL